MHLFVSDIHLKSDDSDKAACFINFLNNIDHKKCKNLFLLGDIFDLWVADHKVFISKYKKVVDAISNLKKSGLKIHYFEGNHDLYLERFWRDKIGLQIYTEATYMTLDNLTIRLEHGDLTNPEDIQYLKYRAFLAKPIMHKIAYILPGKIIDYFGNQASNKSRSINHQSKWDIKKVLKAHIKRVYQDKAFDAIITGHLHERVDEIVKIESHSIRNINLGWWDKEYKALCLEDAKFSWLDLN